MILLIDNYDSFFYNLFQLIGEFEPNLRVVRNDELSVAEIRALDPAKIIISPGPGRPADAGVIMEVVQEISPQVPTLGVCLGHQAICAAYGAKITYAQQLLHGKQSQVKVDQESKIFRWCDAYEEVARYHSLAADCATLPAALKVTALAPDGEVMAVEHRSAPIYGVQFHPESILTPHGKLMIEAFLAD